MSVLDVVEERKSLGFAKNQTTIPRSAVCRLVAAHPKGTLLVKSAERVAE
jgi:hypothetical protein